ncbi:R3H domain-containing protein [Plectosphaerella cucumerina]|uniref:R3H domain-containing protein n=1 Tax=Plectosphaerella cucumerina TaxID=40658 RepID=A0A8K0X8V8_9PEZI|nr:R3H domain-containing protein [Plectosphaerella cucumerina]
METSTPSQDLPRPSFAKVAAASASKDKAPSISAVRRVTPPGQEGSDLPKTSAAPPLAVTPQIPPIANGSSKKTPPANPALGEAPGPKADGVDSIVEGLKELRAGARTPSLVVNGSAASFTDKVKMLHRDGSDESQRADSNSELGTKPPSLDGKSITSGTTFALDEKESLRPDDSASVKAAAAEDDDAFSFRGPLLPNSRMGSDLAARARGIQLGDMPERRPLLVTSGSQSQGLATPQSASSDQQNTSSKANMAKITDLSNYMNTLHGQTPDEKLLEAMSSQKDRLFVLRLEAELIKFVTKSKEPFMDFPPSNSFCRMLTHKLADYYHMTHQFEPRIQSVRIFRTPYARVPESLANLGIPEPKVEAPAPAVLPRKIMRRGEENGTGSGSPSKAASEVGNDGKEKGATSNQKMTREEREEAYNKARERIFGSSEKTGETTPDQEGENGISRASSVSAKDKANANKRGKNKQRRDDTDSLDSRHLYGPFGPQQSWAQQPQYAPVANHQYPMAMQQPYNGQMQPMYPPQPPLAYPAHMHPAGYPQYQPAAQGYQAPPVQPQQPLGPGQPLPPRPQMGGPPGAMYGSPVPAAPQPAWQQAYSPNVPAPALPGPTSAGAVPYAPRGTSAPPSAPTMPYAYGQLPAHLSPNDPKSQHPIPGSYNRHAFNPKTQSFVPGGAMGPMQQPQPPFSAPGSHHGSPQIPSPHLAYSGYQPTGPAAGYGAPGAYGMARQGSSNSIPSYHSSAGGHHPGVQQAPPTGPSYTSQGLPQNPPPHIPNKPAPPQGPAGQFGHLPQYGNPATLPQKPNTGL